MIFIKFSVGICLSKSGTVVEFKRSHRGFLRLYAEGHAFYRKETKKDRIYWQCTKYSKYRYVGIMNEISEERHFFFHRMVRFLFSGAQQESKVWEVKILELFTQITTITESSKYN